MKKTLYVVQSLKRKFEGSNIRFRNNVLQPLPYWIASLITGLIAVLYAKLFALGELFSFYVFHLHAWYLFILSPICFLASWWVVKRYSGYARGSGIPQVMSAIEFATPKHNKLVDKLLSIRVMIVKIISSLLMIIGGGAIGREGPTIQIAACIFRKVNQLTPKYFPKISRRNMIMTGAAAGLAAAFNTPLGGIVFAVEELAKTHINNFKIAIFSAVIIAGLTAQGILGPYLYLGYPDVRNLSSYIFFGVIIVALVAGLMGSIMSKLILMLLKWKSTFKKSNEIFYVLGCAIIISIIAYFFNENILGSGKAGMSEVLFTSNKYSGWGTSIYRTVGPILSFTTGASGGIFAPSLGVGAGIGSLIAHIMHETATNSNLLILVGMVAFLTGVTRSPFTSAILVLEMTDRHNVIFYLMVAGMAAAMISSLVDKRSLYDHLKHQYMEELIKGEKEIITTNEEQASNVRPEIT
jgi:H+/Cl- antiporter ClcA